MRSPLRTHARPAGLLALGLLLAVGLGLPPTTAAAPLLGGFVQGAQAFRVQQNDALGDGKAGDRSYPRSEMRAQVTAQDGGDMASFFLRLDMVADGTQGGSTTVDFREGYIKLYLARWVDLKLGRQVATWGTGDLLFANDLFAKDWEAFFTGLQDAYLKLPQDLLRATFYVGSVTAEVAASPYYTPDALPGGVRLSLYNPFMQKIVGADLAPPLVTPTRTATNGELFGRLFGYAGSLEWAFYGYHGFWPTPQGAGMADSSGYLFYPRLWSAGASLRGPIGPVLANAEAAAYISPDDEDGTDPTIANSEIRGFVGVEKGLGNDWTLGAQYFAQYMLDYDAYKKSYEQAFRTDDVPVAELRSTLTARITKYAMNQTLLFSLFGFWGVTESDWHLRPLIDYKISDTTGIAFGANLVDGDHPYTTFGQFADNSNIFLRLRYSF